MDHRHRLAGGGVKPPKGAVVKSHGAERLGKGKSGTYQVGIWKLNVSEPLTRSREVATFSQKPRSMNRSEAELVTKGNKRGDKYNGNLFTGYTMGVIQAARTLSGLGYGTRESA